MFCTKCGKKADRGKYCTFCGALLHEKTLDFENTKTLMRSNLKIEDFPKPKETHNAPASDGVTEKGIISKSRDAESITLKVDSSQTRQHIDDEFIEDVQRSVESRMSFLTQFPDEVEENTDEVIENLGLNNRQYTVESSLVEEDNSAETEETTEAEETVIPVEEVQVEEETTVAEEPNEESETVEQNTDEIKEDISYDSFSDLMTDSAETEETTEAEETVIPVEEVQVEEETTVAEEPNEESETVEQNTDEIKEDISYDSFSDLMTDSAETEETTEAEETVIPSEEVQVEETTPTIEEQNEYSEKTEEVDKEESNDSEPQIDDSLEKEMTESKETGKLPTASIPYSDIDPMFGPPPTMNYTTISPQPRKVEKTGFFKKKFGKK